jgi:hypothetical protein
MEESAMLDVTDSHFGAKGDGTTDDSGAIQEAIQEAGKANGDNVVYFPPGTYRLGSGLHVQSDGVILSGQQIPGQVPGQAVLLHQPPPPGLPFVPVLFQRGGELEGQDPKKLRNVGIRDLTVKFHHGGPDDSAGIQFNACIDWFCERVSVQGDGNGMVGPHKMRDGTVNVHGSKTNGIAVSWGSRDGVISGCTVDGVSKPGIYLAWARRATVIGCEVKNGKCIAPDLTSEIAAVGFSAGSGFDVEFIDCHAHHCLGNGFHISNLSAHVVKNIETLNEHQFRAQIGRFLDKHPEDDESFNNLPPGYVKDMGIFDQATTRYEPLDVAGAVYSSLDKKWLVTLNTPAPSMLTPDSHVIAGYRPFRRVKVIGGRSHDNGSATAGGAGLVVGSQLAGSVGSDVLISGLRCEKNAAQGISISAGEDIRVHDCQLFSNQSGIVVSDVGTKQANDSQEAVENQTERVVISGGEVRENTAIGVLVRSANDVTVENIRISRALGSQSSGIMLRHSLDVPPTNKEKRATNVKIRGIEYVGFDGAPGKLVDIESNPKNAVEKGIYSIVHAGSPEDKIYAPPGSEYTDRSTGKRYLKVSAGTSSTEWQEQPKWSNLEDLLGEYWSPELSPMSLSLLCGGGASSQRFGGPGRLFLRKVGTTKTEGGTTQVIVSVMLPNDSLAQVEAVVLAHNASGSHSAVYRRAAAFKNKTGQAQMIGTTQTIGTDALDGASVSQWSFVMAASGGRIQVVANSGSFPETVSWMARVDVTLLSF